nr:PAS domain S-box protein [Deltaproteobacteria bacterium]
MNDHAKTKKQLIAELRQLRREIAERPRFAAAGPKEDKPVPEHGQKDSEHIRPTSERNVREFINRLNDAEAELEADLGRGIDVVFDRQRKTPLLLRQAQEALVQEISQRRQAEEDLKDSERKRAALIDAVPALISYIDADFHYRWVNKYYERWFGVKAECVQSCHVKEVLGEAAWERVRPYMERALAGETVTNEERMPYQYGEPRWVRVAYAPDRDTDGSVSGFVVHVVDIAELKQVEEELRQSRAKLEAVLNSLPVAVWISDAHGSVVQTNKAVDQIWGKAPIPYGIDTYGEYKGWWADTGEPVKAEEWALARAVMKGETSTGEVIDIERFDGRRGTILNNASPVKNSEGRIIGGVAVAQDITILRSAEQALRESEEKFRSVFEQAAVGIGRVRFTDAQWIDVNDAFCRMLGYSREELLSIPWPEVTHSDDLELDLIPFRRMASGELDRYTVEKRFIHHQGHHIWARLTLSLVRDANSQPDYEIAIIENITERKQAEDALRKAKDGLEERIQERTRELQQSNQQLLAQGEMLHKIIENVPVMLASYEASGKVNLLNRQLREIVGSTQDHEESDIMERIYPDPAYRQEVLTFMQKAPPSWKDIVMHTADGKELDTSWMSVRLSDASYIGIGIDISERKRAERALHEALVEAEEGRRILDTLMEYVPEGIAIADAPDVRIRRISRYGMELSGKPAELLQNIGVEELVQKWDVYTSDGITPARNEDLPLTRATQRGEIVRDEEWVLGQPDGKRVPILCTAGPMRNREGRITGGIIAWRDITGRKKAEQALQASEKALRQLSVKLLNAQEDERKLLAMELHDSIAASLAATKIKLEIVLQRPELKRQQVQAEIAIAVELIHETNQNVRRLMGNLRPAMLDDLGLIAALQTHVRRFQQQYIGIAVTVSTELEEEVIPERLRIVLFRITQEAFTNVAKHSQATRARISLRKGGERLCLEVRDNGRGFNIDSTSTSRSEEAGFGLTSMKERTRFFGGTFTLESFPGKGTTVRACWPLRETDSLPVPAEPRPTVKQLPQEILSKILLVEDNEIFRHAFRDNLFTCFPDVHIEEAGEGARALELMREWRPQLIFMDINLPGENGLTLTARTKEIAPATHVIVLTSYDTPEYREAAAQAGASGFLVKGTVGMDEIAAVIQTAMQR